MEYRLKPVLQCPAIYCWETAAKRLMRQAGAWRSQARAVSWERLAPAWRVTEMAKLEMEYRLKPVLQT